MHWTQHATRADVGLLAAAAIPLYDDVRRFYHAMPHLDRMFAWAYHLGMVYDPELDKAIWAHDAILDGKGAHEQRSSAWLLAIEPDAHKASDLVLSTITHTPGADNRLLILDLMDFTDAAQSIANTALLVQEAAALSNTPRDAALRGMMGYLGGLADRLATGMENKDVPAADKPLLADILEGVRATQERIAHDLA